MDEAVFKMQKKKLYVLFVLTFSAAISGQWHIWKNSVNELTYSV